ncbi:MAG: tagatose 1,6-diphosphate aldolase [Chloroflexota bacterium]
MATLSTGKLRGLQQVANPNGMLTVCAIDHRGSLKRALQKANPNAANYQDIVDFKLDTCRVLGRLASAVLLDPVYAAAEAVAAGSLPGNIGLLVSIEKSGYAGESTARLTELLPDWSVSKIKKMGASAVKLLIYFRPDIEGVASKQLDLVKRVADECAEQDIALLVESLAYPAEGENDFPARKPELVAESARKLTALPIDVLKAEFPADMEYEKDENKLLQHCKALDEASRLPWVLLSAGVTYDTFREQVRYASRAGASGFLAGRALWQEAVQFTSREQRVKFLENTALSRLKEISEIVESSGIPWYRKLGSDDGRFSPAGEGWYQRY